MFATINWRKSDPVRPDLISCPRHVIHSDVAHAYATNIRHCLFSVSDPITFRQRAGAFWRWVKTKIAKLNLFQTEASWNDEHRRRYEVITTRVYLLLLMFSILILIAYTAFTVQTQSFTVTSLKQSKFEQLASNPHYAPTLDCPCRNISIPYNSFVSISPRYHQLCSSDFVIYNSFWMNLIYYGSELIEYSYDDYRRFLVPHFRLLSYLCTLASDTYIDALSTFRSSSLISTRAQSRQAIQAQMLIAVNQFNSSVPETFLRKLDFVRQMAQGNGLVSSISSNWYIPSVSDTGYAMMASRSYGENNCSCGTNSMCTSPASIDRWTVPGFLVGCYPLESLLQSTLQCLYDVTCIMRLRNPKQPSIMTIRPLNSTRTSPYVTVQSLVNVLMVDRWESNINYEHYYTACAPRECTYIVIEQLNVLYTITTIIALYGGLTVVLKVIVPILIKIAQYLIRCRRSRMEVTVATIPDHEGTVE